MLKKFTNKKGFTLMEMLIVVAIIGILIAIAIPTFSNALTKARISADEANVRSYYAEVMTNYMLKDSADKDKKLSDYVTGTTPEYKADKKDKITAVSVGGAKYELQAGSCVITVDDDKETISIVYTPTNEKKFAAVTIPGGATSGGTTGDSDSTEKP